MVIFSFIAPRYSGRDQPPLSASPGEDYGNDAVFTLANGEKSFLTMVGLRGRNLKYQTIPDSLGAFEIDTVSCEVGPALVLVPLKVHLQE
jgi:hypothetical protein